MQFFPTTDEDFQYFRAQGYTGSINDMHFNALGDLGYTGALTDRVHAYLVGTYGSYHRAMHSLRSGVDTFSLGTNYRANFINPEMVLDFASNYFRVGGSDVTLGAATTYTGASTSTMTNSSGDLVTVASGTPRVGNHTYNGSSWVNSGLLLESEARTNIFLHSGDLTNAAWGLVGSTYVGTLLTATGVVARIYQTQTITTAVHTVSFDVSAGTATVVAIRAIGFDTQPLVWFDLSTGSVGTEEVGITGFIEEIGPGVFRCSASFSSVTDLAGNFSLFPCDADGSNAVTVGKTINVFRGQSEVGSAPSSYIPTTTTSVTRAAQTLTIPSANMPWGAGVSIQLDGTFTGESSTVVDWTLDANNGILVQSGASDFTFTQEAATVVDTVTGGSYTSGVNVPFSLASRHGSTFINGAVNGVALTANLTPTALPDLSASDFGVGTIFMGNLGKVRVWPDDIGDLGIVEASSA